MFTWAVGPEDDKDKKNDDKSENGDKSKSTQDDGSDSKKADEEKQKNEANGSENRPSEEDEPDEPKPIETDRPDFTEASSTVGRGRIQLEAGYTFIRDRSDGTTTKSHSYPEALLRIGMFADWFELRLGQNFSNTRTPVVGFVDTLSGGEDLYLGIKLALTEQNKYLPETALIVQSLIPTGHPDLTANQMLPGMNYLFGWDIIDDCLSAGGSFQANRTIDDVGHYYVEVAQSFTLGYSLTKKLGAYTEWFAFYPCGALAPDVGPQHYFDGGFTYKVTDNLQLDIRAGVGLNRRAEDFFAGSGFAVRY